MIFITKHFLLLSYENSFIINWFCLLCFIPKNANDILEVKSKKEKKVAPLRIKLPVKKKQNAAKKAATVSCLFIVLIDNLPK